MDRRPPRLEEETPDRVELEFLHAVERALLERHGRSLSLDGRRGHHAVVLLAAMPMGRRVHEVFVFARGESARDRAVDFLDGLMAELARTGGPEEGFHLPLDWVGNPWAGNLVFVRGEVRDYGAEEDAAKLLEEEPPPRGLDFIR